MKLEYSHFQKKSFGLGLHQINHSVFSSFNQTYSVEVGSGEVRFDW